MTKRTRIVIGSLLALVIAAAIVFAITASQLEPRLRDWVAGRLSHALESEIELGAVHLRWMPLQLHAHDLTVRHHGRRDIPPLLVVKAFIVDLDLLDLWSSTVDRVWVDGLEISIPPKDPASGKRPIPRPAANKDDGEDSPGLVIRHLTATNTRLTLVPREEGKNPKVWDIFELDMKNLKGGEPATFTASLLNPIPYGKIESSGTFGPWSSDDPGNSPIGGQYTFAADLGTINGLAGQVSAAGTMSGRLDTIATQGETKTPDFRLTELKGISLPLNTSYEAVVDGTKGDVELTRVDITLGKSKLQARGLVEGTKGIKGKRVVVNVKSTSADLSQLLQLVSKGPPPADGILILDAAMDLVQGKAPILDRLALEGSVRAERVKFSKAVVQDKIDELSRRGQGRPEDASIDEMASKMATKFALKKGVFSHHGLSFTVQGADIRLDGTHSMRTGTVDFAGEVLLKATVSQTQTGFKSWMLKPFDPLFKKNGAGTRLVIKIAGTQDEPKVAVDIGKTIKGK